MDIVLESTKLTFPDNNLTSKIDLVPGINTTKVSPIDTNDEQSPSISLPSLSLSFLSLLLPWLLNTFQLTATDFDINPEADHINPVNDITFIIVHQGCALYLYLLQIFYYDIQYLVECIHINTANCDCDNGIAQFNIVHHRCALYLYVVPKLYYDIQYLIGYNNINTTICDNNNLHPTDGLFFLQIIMEKKIYNTSEIDVDDNNFGFDLHFNTP